MTFASMLVFFKTRVTSMLVFFKTRVTSMRALPFCSPPSVCRIFLVCLRAVSTHWRALLAQSLYAASPANETKSNVHEAS